MFALPQSDAPAAPPPAAYERRAGPDAAAPALRPLLGRRCVPGEGGEITVCGRADGEQYRLRPLPPIETRPNPLGRPITLKLGPVRIQGLSAAITF